MDLKERGSRKVKSGKVLSNKMNKTIVVEVKRTLPHPKYGKVITQTEKLYAHHEGEPLQVGDQVNVIETRPLSKLKRWRTVV